jgi:hypothetical protein
MSDVGAWRVRIGRNQKMGTMSDNYRRRRAGSEHETVPHKFDKAADEAAKEQYHKEHPLSTLFTTEGKPINTAQRQRARIKAQMESHKKRSGY